MRKILVPLDGSAESESILPEAVRMVPEGGELHLLHVVPPMPMPVGANPVGTVSLTESAQDYLQKVRSSLGKIRGFDHVRCGEAADRIVQLALELNIDVIAMATHAHRGLTRWYLGSVAEAVVRKSELPVLLRRPEIAAPNASIRRILVPLDASETAQAVLEVVKPLAAEWKAELVLLHVKPKVNDPAPQWAMKGAPSAEGVHEHRYQDLADELEAANLTAWPMVTEGEAALEIVRSAREVDADLVAMATHGRRGFAGLLFGSVTRDVLRRIDRPTLLIRPTKGARYG